MTEENDDLVDLLDNEEMDATEMAKKVNNVMNKVKYKAFGKVSVSSAKQNDKDLDILYQKRKDHIENKNEEQIKEVEINISEKLLERQRSEYEEKLKYLNEVKSIKGNQAALFKLKAKIVGEKRPSQEAVSMVDPDNKELLFEPEKNKRSICQISYK